MKAEIERRQSNTDKVLCLFRAHPQIWLHWRRFERMAGACGWRSRIANARAILKRDGGAVQWNTSITRSAYRYLPQAPQGRDGAELVPARWNETGAYQDDGFRLTSEKA